MFNNLISIYHFPYHRLSPFNFYPFSIISSTFRFASSKSPFAWRRAEWEWQIKFAISVCASLGVFGIIILSTSFLGTAVNIVPDDNFSNCFWIKTDLHKAKAYSDKVFSLALKTKKPVEAMQP